MGLGSGIEWTESTWNPVTGCDKISPGCKYCYAERMANRLHAMDQPNYRNGFELTLQPQMVDLPLTWRKPQTIFVNSMSDLFHKDVPDEYIVRVARVMALADWHTYQVLTKRSERMAEMLRTGLRFAAELPHVWWGVSGAHRFLRTLRGADTLRIASAEQVFETAMSVISAASRPQSAAARAMAARTSSSRAAGDASTILFLSFVIEAAPFASYVSVDHAG